MAADRNWASRATALEPPSMSSGTIEEMIAERVAQRLAVELAPIRVVLEDLRRMMPPQLGDAARVAQLTGWSPATVRRRIADGTIRSSLIGKRRMVDLAALRPASGDEIAVLAARARRGA